MKLCFLLLLTSQIKAATLRGHILDSQNKEPLVGATISDKQNNKIFDAAGLDGTFSIKQITKGKHTFVIRYLGYALQEKEIDVANDQDVADVDILLVPDAVALNQVEVVAKYDKESNQYARNAEKNSNTVLNVMSSKTIQLSPDLTVANVLQRVSGVSVQKTSNSGEGQYAIIRGMDKRYNYTLVNGIKIPSPDDKNRYVPMDIFPAELISNLEVIKALTPEMEGDAIGGAMNLVMKDAPDKLLLTINGSMGYNELFMNRPFYQFNSKVINMKSPLELNGIDYHAKISDFPIGNLKYTPITPMPNLNGGFTIGNRFLNKKLGVIFSVSNQNSYSGSNTLIAIPKAQPDENTQPAFETDEQRLYSTLQNRLGIHNKIDYVFNDKNKISLYSIYFQLDKYISRHSIETSLATGVGNVVTKDKSQMQQQRIYNSTLQGFHTLVDKLKLDWSLVYSKATASYPDEVQLQYNSTIIDSPIIQSLSHKWRHNSDQDLAGYLNMSWYPKLFETEVEIRGGAMYRHKTRSNFYNEYSLTPTPSPQYFTTIDNATFGFSGGSELGSPVNQNDYDVNENVSAEYGEVKFSLWNKLHVLGGVRVEQYYMDWMTPMPETFIGKSGKKSYTDVLPSVHLKYNLTEKQNLRLSYFSSISRPGFFEVVPYYVQGDVTGEEGNPYLKRAKAQNIDFRYELFPKPTEQLLLGVFYKQIADPIEFGLIADLGPSTLNLKPQNYGTATNYGFELVYLKYFKYFGVSANYTYTKSSITTYKKTYQRNANVGLTIDSISVTRPMQGQADHIANLSLLYKNTKVGLDMQLSFVYTGLYISQVSGYNGLDYWAMPSTTLDFSFEKKLSKKVNLSIYGKARNLLNTPAITRILKDNYYMTGKLAIPEQDSSSSIVVQKENYQRNFLLGIRYSF